MAPEVTQRGPIARMCNQVAANEMAALRWMFRGVDFAALCTWLGEQVGEEDAAPEALRLLGRWLEDELLVAP